MINHTISYIIKVHEKSNCCFKSYQLHSMNIYIYIYIYIYIRVHRSSGNHGKPGKLQKSSMYGKIKELKKTEKSWKKDFLLII